jgi:hypothetical protein
MRQKLLVVIVLLVFCLSWMVTSVHAQVTARDTTGGKSYIALGKSGVIYAFPILISPQSLVWAIGVNWASTGLGYVWVALYSNNYTAGSNRPASLLTDSGTVFVATSRGWQDIPVAIRSVTYGYYWVAIQISAVEAVYAITYTGTYYYRGFGPFNTSWPDSNCTLDNNEDQWNMRVALLPPVLIAQHLNQQNQINALPASPSAKRISSLSFSLNCLTNNGKGH